MINYSVILLSYNKLAQIKYVLEAITAPQVTELILCDDCSSDGTVEWAESTKRFNQIWKKRDHTCYALNTLRNNGVKLASNTHIILLDADCVPESTLFDGHDKVFEQYPEAISIGFTHHSNENGSEVFRYDIRTKMLHGGEIGPLPWNECFGGNISFTKSVWDKINGFDENFNGYWGFDDIDFGYRASKSGIPLIAHKQTVAKHLRHPQTAPEHGNCFGHNYNLLIEKHGKIYG